MKGSDLILLGGLGLGAYFLYKYFSGSGSSLSDWGLGGGGDTSGGQAGSAGCGAGGICTIDGKGAINPPSSGGTGSSDKNYNTGGGGILPLTPTAPFQAGTIFQQVYNPAITRSTAKSASNTVIVAANVPTGGVIVIPITYNRPKTPFASTFQGNVLKPQPAQPPLNIKNVFGFPVIPKLISTTGQTANKPTLHKSGRIF